jgi:hypothetical protein
LYHDHVVGDRVRLRPTRSRSVVAAVGAGDALVFIPVWGVQDKETFHLAWRKIGQQYAMAPPVEEPLGQAFYQHDFQGRKIFQHRNGAKWKLGGPNPCIHDFEQRAACISFLEELAGKLGEKRGEAAAADEFSGPRLY